MLLSVDLLLLLLVKMYNSSRQFKTVFHTDSIAMRLWSTSCHLSFDLFISVFNLIDRKSKIYKRTHEADKKSRLEFNFFADNFFSIG